MSLTPQLNPFVYVEKNLLFISEGNVLLLVLLAAIINYAPALLQRMSTSLTDTQAQLFLAAIALTKVVGVGIGE